MPSKKRTGAAAGGLSKSTNNTPLLLHQPQPCFEGENLSDFLKSIQREIESAKALEPALPYKFWIKQQFAVGVNEVTRVLERMPPNRGTKISSEEHIRTDADGKAPSVCLQAILASDCNPRWLTKHLPALAASRNVPLISVKDRKEGSLRLGELIKLKTAIAIGIKAKGSAVNQLIKEVLDDRVDRIEA
ncbi:60S ribosomal protein 15.5kD/SNU13, NHP2/L7A family [Handroanthus impetiginosus]|uniref:60S ribosomal protein 15.5kD/SNU13, NHP2/L7A family n=1 Tax=Handroanthus impetiginosus TaxID=429701 RepID=A0A2G9GYF4_9LAMI|nr:60S ribosomal protein 15.5kD/SNU13, NHP2/L7A family [Handroanthus impetiginosus]